MKAKWVGKFFVAAFLAVVFSLRGISDARSMGPPPISGQMRTLSTKSSDSVVFVGTETAPYRRVDAMEDLQAVLFRHAQNKAYFHHCQDYIDEETVEAHTAKNGHIVAMAYEIATYTYGVGYIQISMNYIEKMFKQIASELDSQDGWFSFIFRDDTYCEGITADITTGRRDMQWLAPDAVERLETVYASYVEQGPPRLSDRREVPAVIAVILFDFEANTQVLDQCVSLGIVPKKLLEDHFARNNPLVERLINHLKSLLVPTDFEKAAYAFKERVEKEERSTKRFFLNNSRTALTIYCQMGLDIERKHLSDLGRLYQDEIRFILADR